MNAPMTAPASPPNIEKLRLKFVDAVISTLRLSEERLRDAPKRADLEKKDAEWWQKKPKRIDRNLVSVPMEEAIRDAILLEISEIQAQKTLGSSFGDHEDFIAKTVWDGESLRQKAKRIGRKSRPVDLRITFVDTARLELHIEAKVLAFDREIKSEYLGRNGLERFADSDEPYTREPVGGMVAFVVNKTAKDWEDAIEAECLAGALKTKTSRRSFNTVKDVLTTKVQWDKNDVLVFHFAMEFEASPSLRGR